MLAVCGGYQLLGRFYQDVSGSELPGVGLLPLHTVAGARRMIGDVLLDCAWAGQTLAGFENHAGRTILDPGAEPLGRVVSGFGNDGESGAEGCRQGRVYGTYLHGPLLPRNPWFADRVLAEALAHATGGEPEELAPLADELELAAHAGLGGARSSARRPVLAGPEGAEIDGRVARLPAREEALDRRVHDDVLQLLAGEQPRALDRCVPRLDVVERPVRQVGGEDDVDDVAAGQHRARRDRVDERDRPLELDVGLDRELLAQLAPERLDQRLADVDAASRQQPVLLARLLLAAEQHPALPAEDRRDADARLHQ